MGNRSEPDIAAPGEGSPEHHARARTDQLPSWEFGKYRPLPATCPQPNLGKNTFPFARFDEVFRHANQRCPRVVPCRRYVNGSAALLVRVGVWLTSNAGENRQPLRPRTKPWFCKGHLLLRCC